MADQVDRLPEGIDVNPEDVVDRFIGAVNAKDMDTIVECFASDGVMQDEPGTVFASGHDQIRAHFGRFLPKSPEMHGEIVSRIQARSWVVQEERCSGLVLDEPIEPFNIVVAYRVKDGKIIKSIGLQ